MWIKVVDTHELTNAHIANTSWTSLETASWCRVDVSSCVVSIERYMHQSRKSFTLCVCIILKSTWHLKMLFTVATPHRFAVFTCTCVYYVYKHIIGCIYACTYTHKYSCPCGCTCLDCICMLSFYCYNSIISWAMHTCRSFP